MMRGISLLALVALPLLAGACSAASSRSPTSDDGQDTGGDLTTDGSSADGTSVGTDVTTGGTVTSSSTSTTGGTSTGPTTSTGTTGTRGTTGGVSTTTSASTTGTTATSTTSSSSTGTTGSMVMTCPDPPAGVKAAPCGYYTKGNKVYALDGSVHQFHGLARPSLEWSATGENISGADADLMKTWKANVVRFSLNQAYWLDATQGAAYQRTISNTVDVYHKRGLDVILDLHWNVIAGKGGNGQRNGPDSNSTTFWSQVAAAYKDKGYVLFELYNEPHDLTDDQWYSSMSGLYNTVRSAGADNVAIIGGLDWAYDLTVVSRKWPANMGYNIMFASHPYQDKQDLAGKVDVISSTWPIIFTEFGDRSGSCSTSASTNVISHADQKGYSWTGWGWYPADCTFPSLIADWMANPTAQGTVVKNALAKY